MLYVSLYSLAFDISVWDSTTFGHRLRPAIEDISVAEILPSIPLSVFHASSLFPPLIIITECFRALLAGRPSIYDSAVYLRTKRRGQVHQFLLYDLPPALLKPIFQKWRVKKCQSAQSSAR